MALKVGCDPEFFLFDTKDKMYVSAHDLVPGSKRDPFPLNKGAVQVDGTAVEFNIDPASSAKEFSDNIIHVLIQIRKMIPSRYEFRFTPAIYYDKKYFDSLPENCKEMGCEPDYDSRGKLQKPPQPKDTLRTAGGHIHLGWTDVKDPYCESHMMDCIQINSNAASYIQSSWDFDTTRHILYGQNSPFRPKSYGVECRGFSNVWVKYPVLHEYLFDYATLAFNRADNPSKQWRSLPVPYPHKELVI